MVHRKFQPAMPGDSRTMNAIAHTVATADTRPTGISDRITVHGSYITTTDGVQLYYKDWGRRMAPW